MKVNIKHREVAKDIWDGSLSQHEIARKHGVCDRTIRRWQREQDFKSFLDEMDATYRKTAKIILARHVVKAAKSLVKLIETETVRTHEGEQQRFKYRPETVLKAAIAISEMAGLRPK